MKEICGFKVYEKQELEAMSIDELSTIQAQYATKEAENFCGMAKEICRTLGEEQPERYRPKYRYSNGGLGIYVDDYGHVFSIYWNKKTVAGDGPIIPGEWLQIVKDLYPQVLEKKAEEQRVQDEKKKKDLIESLYV